MAGTLEEDLPSWKLRYGSKYTKNRMLGVTFLTLGTKMLGLFDLVK
jgi:hypothetical protein